MDIHVCVYMYTLTYTYRHTHPCICHACMHACMHAHIHSQTEAKARATKVELPARESIRRPFWDPQGKGREIGSRSPEQRKRARARLLEVPV